PAIQYGNSDDIKVGEWVLAVGNPFNLNSTVTAGIISAKHRKLDIIPDEHRLEAYIQTDAAVNPGNSGGALVDTEGKLIGINSAIASPTGTYAGYSFAIPVNLMKRIVDDLIQYKEVQKAALGVQCNDLDASLISELNLKVNSGVFVKDVIKGGSAQSSGILPKDVITAIEGNKISKFDDLRENVALAKIGQIINVTINRGGIIKTIPVKLKPYAG
ncbi:MAG TPA: trypsin-like peptidase domain-containing protein, partial [Saprospiraceae bacterium]|nr:trypsin-like peptidase domain-containing protein [Saprospiraceae bacterium]